MRLNDFDKFAKHKSNKSKISDEQTNSNFSKLIPIQKQGMELVGSICIKRKKKNRKNEMR